MPKLIYEVPEGYMTLGQVADRLHTSRVKVTELVKTGLLRVHADVRDKRQKLIKIEDVEKLLQPREVVAP